LDYKLQIQVKNLPRGGSVRLVDLGLVKGRLVDFKLALPFIREVLSTWRARGLRIRDGFEALEDELYTAYWALNPRYIPVGEGNVSLDALDFYHNVRGVSYRVYESILDLAVKDTPTPLVRLRSLEGGEVRVWAKLEWYHPFSLSIKDRIAWFMLLNNPSVKPGVRVVEATSTNTGLGLVGVANNLNLRSRIFLPSTAQRCVDYIFELMGAKVERAGGSLTTEILEEVRRAARAEGAVHPDQFSNDLNLIAHLQYTAKELDYQARQAGLRVKSIISGLGTSGHLAALSIYFKSKLGDVRVYGVQPARGDFIPGLRRVETGMKWLPLAELEGVIDVTLEEAFQEVVYTARREGILIGLSAGAVVKAVKDLARRGVLTGDVVMIVPDHGLKYIEILEALYSKTCPETTLPGRGVGGPG
jgi:cysteine synthase/O-phosphoserine sulfhydrylase/cystathionine beta-synthase